MTNVDDENESKSSDKNVWMYSTKSATRIRNVHHRQSVSVRRGNFSRLEKTDKFDLYNN